MASVEHGTLEDMTEPKESISEGGSPTKSSPRSKRSTSSACVQLEDLEPGGVAANSRANSSRPFIIQDMASSVQSVGGNLAFMTEEPYFSPVLSDPLSNGLPGQTDSRSAHSVAMDSFTTAASSLSLNGDFCKICHCGSEPNMPLINPCLCCGSLKYVHQECLQRWIKSADIKRCELCKYPFSMQSKVKPFCQWEKLDMTQIERRKLFCSVSFHIIAITCVIWSLYVLIDKTAQEIKSGELQWPFWTKLVVVAIGVTGGLVFMYIQCKVYIHLCRKWKAYNRIIVVQDAPEGIHKHKTSTLGKEISRQDSQLCQKQDSPDQMVSSEPDVFQTDLHRTSDGSVSTISSSNPDQASSPTTNNVETQTALRAVNFMDVLGRRSSDSGIRDPGALETNSVVARILEDIQDVEKNTIFFTDYEIEDLRDRQPSVESPQEPVLASHGKPINEMVASTPS